MESGVAERVTVGCVAGSTVIVVVPEMLPPGPVQVRPKSEVADGDTASDPAVPLAPFHPPLAKQLAVLLELHVREVLEPAMIVSGLPEKASPGCSTTGVTVILTELVALPVVFIQVITYVVVVAGEIDSLPERVFEPLHPSDALQDVALLDAQERIEDCPAVMRRGEADIVTVD